MLLTASSVLHVVAGGRARSQRRAELPPGGTSTRRMIAPAAPAELIGPALAPPAASTSARLVPAVARPLLLEGVAAATAPWRALRDRSATRPQMAGCRGISLPGLCPIIRVIRHKAAGRTARLPPWVVRPPGYRIQLRFGRNVSTVSSMGDEPWGVVRGCLFALVVDAVLVVAGWQAWRLLRAAFGT
jgi:hypothetical protein